MRILCGAKGLIKSINSCSGIWLWRQFKAAYISEVPASLAQA